MHRICTRKVKILITNLFQTSAVHKLGSIPETFFQRFSLNAEYFLPQFHNMFPNATACSVSADILQSSYFCRKTVGNLLVMKRHALLLPNIPTVTSIFQVRITEYVIVSFSETLIFLIYFQNFFPEEKYKFLSITFFENYSSFIFFYLMQFLLNLNISQFLLNQKGYFNYKTFIITNCKYMFSLFVWLCNY